MVYDFFYQLQNAGVFEFVLPFLLIFTLVFGILEKTNILGTNKKNINAIVALILGLLFITQFEIVQTLNNFLPKISLFMIVAVMFLLIIGFFGAKVHEKASNPVLWFAFIIVLIAVYWALSPSLGLEMPYFLDYYWDEALLIIGLIVFILLVTKGSSGSGDNKIENLFKR
ncbi:MAG: hypothetical protein ISS82_03505 [Nanoarchaeota archaeon]|nr:hypothetical protein [Nanoarchaeota archaeon]